MDVSWWVIGWGIAAVVVLVAAVLLLLAVLLTRRLVSQAAEITEGLDRVRGQCRPLVDIAVVNDRIGRLAGAYEDASGEDQKLRREGVAR